MIRILMPQTLSTMETELQMVKEKNYRLERRIQKMEADMQRLKADPFFYPFWASKDWEKAYGDDERAT